MTVLSTRICIRNYKPIWIDRDCLFFFYRHSCSCLRAFVFHMSIVNLFCKEKRKYLRTVLMILLRPGRHRVLTPCTIEPETKIITRAKKIPEHKSIFVMCVCFQEVAQKRPEPLEPSVPWYPTPYTQSLQPTLWPTPNFPTIPLFHHPTLFSCCRPDCWCNIHILPCTHTFTYSCIHTGMNIYTKMYQKEGHVPGALLWAFL